MIRRFPGMPIKVAESKVAGKVVMGGPTNTTYGIGGVPHTEYD